jgi:hypothetical protein
MLQEGTKVEGIPLVNKRAANKLKGSKQAPIPVVDTIYAEGRIGIFL